MRVAHQRSEAIDHILRQDAKRAIRQCDHRLAAANRFEQLGEPNDLIRAELQPAFEVEPVDLTGEMHFEMRRLAKLLAFHFDFPT